MTGKTKIILSRRSEWMSRARVFRVFIDGEEKGQIRNGSTEEYPVDPGKHQIYCQVAWYKSMPFSIDLGPGEIEYLCVRSGMKYYWPLFLTMLVGIFINLFFSSHAEPRPLNIQILQLILILPALLYLLYYLTVGRRNYILLEPDKDNVFAG
jgi:hypothetical protein